MKPDFPIRIIKCTHGNILVNAIGSDIFIFNDEMSEKINKARLEMLYGK